MSLKRTALAALLAGVLGAALPGLSRAAMAEPVERTADGLRLEGELVRAGDLKEGVLLLVHGTLAHHRMEVMRAMQAALKERGLSSLAVTLSLSLDARAGMYDCAQPHRHGNADAVAEIAGWVAWLKGQGAGPITLLGHSRGGNQVARYIASSQDLSVVGAALLAPSTGEPPPDEDAVLPLAHGQPDDALLKVPSFLSCGPGMATAAAVRAYYAHEIENDTLVLLERFGTPVLVIAAGADTVVPRLQHRLHEVRGMPRVRAMVVDGADHFFRDLAIEDAADAVAAFVKEVRAD